MLTPKEVSEIIGLGLNNTYKLFGLKGFPKIQIGKKYFVNEEELKKFIQEYKGTKIYLN